MQAVLNYVNRRFVYVKTAIALHMKRKPDPHLNGFEALDYYTGKLAGGEVYAVLSRRLYGIIRKLVSLFDVFERERW